MNQKDKKEMMEVVCEGIDKVVAPILGEVLDNQKEMKGDIKDLKLDTKEIKEVQSDQSDQLETINRKLDSTITRVDRHDVLMKK